MKARPKSVLDELDGAKVGDYFLSLGEVKPLRLSSWTGFALYVQSSAYLISYPPAIKGIYSSGGKDGVQPWMDVNYQEEVEFSQEGKGGKMISLGDEDIDQSLFRTLGDVIPPGGHLMVSYEGDNRIHKETVKSLSIKIPPAATPLGYLLFRSGFQLIKDWYLSEGGFEGPRKLWAEKAPDQKWADIFLKKTADQIRDYLEKENRPPSEARQRARIILELIEKHTA